MASSKTQCKCGHSKLRHIDILPDGNACTACHRDQAICPAYQPPDPTKFSRLLPPKEKPPRKYTLRGMSEKQRQKERIFHKMRDLIRDWILHNHSEPFVGWRSSGRPMNLDADHIQRRNNTGQANWLLDAWIAPQNIQLITREMHEAKTNPRSEEFVRKDYRSERCRELMETLASAVCTRLGVGKMPWNLAELEQAIDDIHASLRQKMGEPF